MLHLFKNIVGVTLIQLLTVQSVFGNDFCLVSKVDDRKIIISNGKKYDDFTFFSSTNKSGKTNQTYHRKEMLECFSVETPTSMFPTQYIESLDPYWEGSVHNIKFITSYCLVNDYYQNDPTNSYQHHKRTDYQIVTYYPNSEEGSDDNVNLSVRSINGICQTSSIGKTNELNDDLWGCYWDEQMVWVDDVCDQNEWKIVYRRRNI